MQLITMISVICSSKIALNKMTLSNPDESRQDFEGTEFNVPSANDFTTAVVHGSKCIIYNNQEANPLL
jgi:hypothetical protein